jgi:hypothetical protein
VRAPVELLLRVRRHALHASAVRPLNENGLQ